MRSFTRRQCSRGGQTSSANAAQARRLAPQERTMTALRYGSRRVMCAEMTALCGMYREEIESWYDHANGRGQIRYCRV